MRTGPRLLTTLLPAPLAFALSATSLTACRNSEIAAGSDTAFATMPGATSEGRAEVGNWLMAIPRGARNRDVTFDFLTWATRPERMKKSALAGNPPTRRS
ncbi:MAG TPA: hypothetical protein VNI02_21615, partial [Blastocatellia bacterium]|nr:hypothetical protein [Blastocatellia bacterium]